MVSCSVYDTVTNRRCKWFAFYPYCPYFWPVQAPRLSSKQNKTPFNLLMLIKTDTPNWKTVTTTTPWSTLEQRKSVTTSTTIAMDKERKVSNKPISSTKIKMVLAQRFPKNKFSPVTYPKATFPMAMTVTTPMLPFFPVHQSNVTTLTTTATERPTKTCKKPGT